MRLASIWRHPVKAIGRERLTETRTTEGAALPGDRLWAVTHDRTRDHGPGWAKKANFLRGVSGPQLMAITAESQEASVTLRHPEAGEITVDPDRDAEHLIAWLDPLWPEDQPRPNGVARCETGFTDVPDPWVSVHSTASHRAVEQKLAQPLSIHRWRGNLWLDGLDLWEEFDLVGKRFRIGDVVLEGRAPITRCKATMANPETGHRDADTLGALNAFGHQEFGLYAEIIEGGTLTEGAEVRL
ncbi:MOSC domain-containing protein [Jannaschia aquimarina]|uniref:MOSC domain protein n=1 Tax=Jannaschia aquimarina TaxID=935700 RepID=A0A0D1D912_9RHOB|nr:MOSC domain-containing protein [Jannaschia aquimarina]KIT16393.1 MOSC domain protein [Jannaschia aquimarina]SNT05518.1 hypothetical protein SAMN05421775_10550 [Jannaschia aquimarina]